MKMSHLKNSTTVINVDIFISRVIQRGGEADSLKFQCAGGLKTRDRCERMQTKVPLVPLWLLEGHGRIEEESGHWINEVWEKQGDRGENKEAGCTRVGGGSSYNERLTACKSCLTPELALEFSVNCKKELGC